MAWQFDGSNDDVAIGKSASLTDFPDGDWTLAVWVKSDDSLVSDRTVIYHFGDTSNNDSISFMISAGDDWRVRARQGGSNVVTVTGPAIDTTSWHILVATRSGDTLEFWVDGTSEGTSTDASWTATEDSGSYTHFLGEGEGATWSRFDGAIAEIARWNRALSDAEIATLSAAYSPAFIQNGLLWYIPGIREYQEVKSGLSVTNDGTVPNGHPRIIYPTSMQYYYANAPSTNHLAVINDSLTFAGTTTLHTGHIATINDSLTYGGSATLATQHNPTISDSLVFGGTGSFNRQWEATINDSLVFGGSAGLNRIHEAVINDSLVFSGTGLLGRMHQAVILDSLNFSGSAVLNTGHLAVVNDSLSFPGTVRWPVRHEAVINDSLIFGGTASVSSIFSKVPLNEDTDLSEKTFNTDTDFSEKTVNSDTDFTERYT